VDGKTGTPLDYLADSHQVKQILQSSPGVMQLFPSKAYFGSANEPYYDPHATSALDTYTKTVEFLIQSGEMRRNIIDKATSFHASMDGFGSNFFADGRYTVLYSLDDPTPAVGERVDCLFGLSNKCHLVVTNVSGDGTVPGRSASLATVDRADLEGVGFCVFDGKSEDIKDHSRLLDDVRVVSDVLHILKGEPVVTCDWVQTAVAVPIPDTTPPSPGAPGGGEPIAFRQFTVLGDSEVRVVDESGFFTGVAANGLIEEQLPDVTFLQSDGSVIITMPSDAPYRIEAVQRGTVPMQVFGTDFAAVEGDVFVGKAQALFEGLRVQQDGLAELENVKELPQLRLEVDDDVDGVPDRGESIDSYIPDLMVAPESIAPEPALVLEGNRDALGRFEDAATLTVPAMDEGEPDLLSTYYSLDEGATWLPYTGTVAIESGSIDSVRVYAVDRLGNILLPDAAPIEFAP
jgi:hypothetical protein